MFAARQRKSVSTAPAPKAGIDGLSEIQQSGSWHHASVTDIVSRSLYVFLGLCFTRFCNTGSSSNYELMLIWRQMASLHDCFLSTHHKFLLWWYKACYLYSCLTAMDWAPSVGVKHLCPSLCCLPPRVLVLEHPLTDRVKNHPYMGNRPSFSFSHHVDAPATFHSKTSACLHINLMETCVMMFYQIFFHMLLFTKKEKIPGSDWETQLRFR